MAQATTFKKQKAQAQTVDTLEAKKYETVPQKLKVAVKGYKYYQPIQVLIAFELERRNKAMKLVNKTGKSFTAIINDALDLMLYTKGIIKEEEVSEYVSDIIKVIYKPSKKITKKKTVKKK